MINPQMMGAGPIPDVPSVKELWKNEKKQYRHWIILLGLGLITIFVLVLIAFILNLSNKANIVANLSNEYLEKNPGKEVEANEYANNFFTRSYLIFPIIELLFLVVGIIAYGTTIFQSYREHNFAKLSSWPTLIIGVAALFSAWTLMEILFFRDDNKFSTSGEVFAFATNILFIIIYFFASAPVSRVRRLFLTSMRIEQLKKDPQFQAMQAQFKNMMNNSAANNPYGPNTFTGNTAPNTNSNNNGSANTTANQAAATASASGQVNNPTVVPAKPSVSPEEKKLREMPLDDLKEVAKRFSLSGYEKMNKQELIDNILRITGKK